MHILFENDGLMVGTPDVNGGDIFVWPKLAPNNRARIGLDGRDSLSVTAAGNVLVPWAFNGVPGFRVVPRLIP